MYKTVLIGRPRLNNRGSSKPAIVFWLLVLGIAGYAAAKATPAYLSYYMFKTAVDSEVVKSAHMYSDADMERRILEQAHEWSVPISHDDIVIEKLIDTIYIHIKWQETIDLGGFYTKTVYFDITREAPLKPGPFGAR